MGIGFRLNLNWDFPIHSHFHTNSSSKLPSSSSSSSSSVRGKEASFNLSRSQFLSIVSEEGATLYRDPLKTYTCSSAAPQILENDYSQMEELKIQIGKRSRCSLNSSIDDSRMLVGDYYSSAGTNLVAYNTSEFSLLMENLDVLERTVASSDKLGLEKEILTQLGRFGALKLFNTCLSRTLNKSNALDLSDVPTELMGETERNNVISDDVDKVVVRSGKKEERRCRRQRVSRSAEKVSLLSLPSKTVQEGSQRHAVSLVKRASNSKSRRLTITRNEAEMSRGIKVIANLERIRTTLEAETGRVASLSCWAEAAGINEKELQQSLRFGWYCRDELLRSTRSLVLYLARNYRGLGIAFEDILQAGNLGILQGAERFDHTRGYRFSTYVQYWVRKSMSKMVAQHARAIQVPNTLNKAINQVQKARKTLSNCHGKHPRDEDIAKFTGLSLAKIRSASKCLRVVGSIDQKMGDIAGAKYLECTRDTSTQKPEEIVMRQHMKRDIHALLKGLDSIERQVLVLRYGFNDYQPKSLEEIGRLFHVSKEWIRKIEKKAMTKLKDKETCTSLTHYLDQ